MAQNGTRAASPKGNKAAAPTAARRGANPDEHPTAVTRSGPIAAAGIKTGEDFANLMSALMSDLIDGALSPNVANATVNAGGKLLKVVEMQYKYGSPTASAAPLSLTLAPG